MPADYSAMAGTVQEITRLLSFERLTVENSLFVRLDGLVLPSTIT